MSPTEENAQEPAPNTQCPRVQMSFASRNRPRLLTSTVPTGDDGQAMTVQGNEDAEQFKQHWAFEDEAAQTWSF